MLNREQHSSRLTIKDPGLANYSSPVRDHVDRIMLVERLRETRALTGFSRIHPQSSIRQSFADKRKILWREAPRPGSKDDWLPAMTTHGEGIFFSLNEARLQKWEQRTEIKSLFDKMLSNFKRSRHWDETKLQGPRFVLLHTLSHLIINRLIFECGYGTAALRERLYVSTDENSPMAGLLIYTAAGDADGTLGGLVRMGRPGNFERIFTEALREAMWCSADPICMEAAFSGGQGPDSCNLASCSQLRITTRNCLRRV